MLTRARLGIGSLVLLTLVVSLLVTVFANQRVQSTCAHGAKADAPAEISPLESPVAAYTAFRNAQAKHDWSCEYQCYTPRRQARFSHIIIIIITALYLEFETDASHLSDTLQSTTKFRNVVLEESSGLYCWLWEVACDIQTLAKSMSHPRLVIVGLATGDVAVGPYEIDVDEGEAIGAEGYDANEGDNSVLERIDNRDEGEEDGYANNGTRTVTEAEVKFQRLDGRWPVDSIDYR